MTDVDTLLSPLADQARGLSPPEIAEIERDQPAPLPAAYRRFLEIAGRGAGGLLVGSDVFHPAATVGRSSILGVGQAARDLLAENDVPFALTENDRVILMHQGYMFDFLRGAGPDPEVWSYCEGDDLPAARCAHFTEWLAAAVAESSVRTSAEPTSLRPGGCPA